MMKFSNLKQIVQECHEHGLMEVIPSTMGEPLLYPQFLEFMELISGLGLKLNLTTNGTFPRFDVDFWANTIIPVCSDIKISVNGVSPAINEDIMDGIDTEKQWENIIRFLAIRNDFARRHQKICRVTLQVTFMERNIAELPLLLKRAIAIGIDRFKGHHLWVTWPEIANENLRKNSESISRWNSMVDQLHAISQTNLRVDGNKILLENVTPCHVEKDAKDAIVSSEALCPFLGREAWIAADGTFNVCCCPTDLRQQFGYFGNAFAQGLMTLWQSAQYQDFVAGWGNHANCQQCNMRRMPLERSET
jgi:MoaA/NifB/PqqE/SkfB family radical SAM enzyme